MRIINENNCEAFFLDYFEGQLNDHQQQLLFAFLRENPKWKKEFDEYREISEADAELAKDDTEAQNNIADVPLRDEENDLIALLEGQLNDTDAQNLQKKLERDTALATAFHRYELTRLKPDLDIVYPRKQELKKGASVVALFARYSAVAALMAGAFIAVWVLSTGENNGNVAQYNPRPVENSDATQPAFITNEKSSIVSQIEEEGAKPGIENANVRASEVASVNGNKSGISAPDETVGDTNKSPKVADAENSRPDRVEMKAMDIKNMPDQLLASLEVDKPLLVKRTRPEPLPEVKSAQPTTELGDSGRSLFGSFLSEIGQSVVDRVKTATDEDVVIEKEEYSEDELVTSTFKLGAFEVYRSKSKK